MSIKTRNLFTHFEQLHLTNDDGSLKSQNDCSLPSTTCFRPCKELSCQEASLIFHAVEYPMYKPMALSLNVSLKGPKWLPLKLQFTAKEGSQGDVGGVKTPVCKEAFCWEEQKLEDELLNEEKCETPEF